MPPFRLVIAGALYFAINFLPTHSFMSSTIINSILHSRVPSLTRLMSSSSNGFPSYPRAAVAVVVRFHDKSSPSISTSTSSTIEPVRYLLIQRSKAPNKGMWSLPGGKIETNEGTMDAAKRELREETGLGDDANNQQLTLKWCNDGPFTCSDAISDGFHYVISQCFAEVIASSQPNIEALDDAMDAKWLSTTEVEEAESKGTVSLGVLKVLKRSELLYDKGLLK